MSQTWNSITCDLLAGGRFKLSPSGLEWAKDGAPAESSVNVAFSDVADAQWTQIHPRQCRLALSTKGGDNPQAARRVRFDGFAPQDADAIKNALGAASIKIGEKSVAFTGHNWGEVDFGFTDGKTMQFLSTNSAQQEDVGNVCMDIDLTMVTNCTHPEARGSKNLSAEVQLQFSDPPGMKRDDHVLEEMRLFVPHTDEEPADEAADEFVRKVRDVAGLSAGTGSPVFELPENVGNFVHPRGRYALDLYEDYVRMHGRTYDYKVYYKDISRMFRLPRPDGINVALVISLDKPVRQGQQRYTNLVLQMPLAQDCNFALSPGIDDEAFEVYAKQGVQRSYNGRLGDAIPKMMKHLTQKKVFVPGKFRTAQNSFAIRCNYRTNDGHLYPLEKSFVYIHKPPTFIKHEDIRGVEIQRYKGQGVMSSRTFDLEITTQTFGDRKTYQFTSIDKNEFKNLMNFLQAKKLEITNMDELEETNRQQEALADDGDEDEDSEDSDFEGGGGGSETSSSSEDEDMSDVDEVGSKPKKKQKKKRSRGSEKAGEKASSPRKRVKDPNAPKRPSSSYLFFSNTMRPKIKEANPDMSVGDMSKKIAEIWRGITTQEKAPYEQMARQDKERYEEEMKNYTPPADLAFASSPRKKARKDPNAPKRALSSYMIFSQEKRAQVDSENADLPPKEKMALLGKMWKALDAESRKPYEEKAEADKQRYANEMKDYVPPAWVAEQKAASSKRKPKKKKLVDPDAPKRPQSSYMLFSNQERAKVTAEHPEWKLTEVAKELGARWKALDADGKKPFEEKRAALVVEYEEKMKTYEEPQWLKDARAEAKISQKKAKYDSDDSESGSDSDSSSGSGSSSSGSGSSSSGSDSDSD